MAAYKVVFKGSVDKDLSNVPKQLIARVWKWLELLKQEPFPRQAIKLEGSEALYRCESAITELFTASIS